MSEVQQTKPKPKPKPKTFLNMRKGVVAVNGVELKAGAIIELSIEQAEHARIVNAVKCGLLSEV